MSIFPFTEDMIQGFKAAEELPVFYEMAYDHKNNCLLRRGGKPYLLAKDDALKVWIYKALKTKRFVFPAYSHYYGSEVDKVIGLTDDKSIAESEIKRYITETVMVNPYIQELSNFSFYHEAGTIKVDFEVTTIYGRFTHESEVYNE